MVLFLYPSLFLRALAPCFFISLLCTFVSIFRLNSKIVFFVCVSRCSPKWKVTKRDADPRMAPVSYGLWKRCEKINVNIVKQGVSLGTQPNVTVCRPNQYMRYSAKNFDKCYHLRRNCPVTPQSQLPSVCTCDYLPSTSALQWLTILAAVFLVIGLLVLYLKTIGTAENGSLKIKKNTTTND